MEFIIVGAIVVCLVLNHILLDWLDDRYIARLRKERDELGPVYRRTAVVTRTTSKWITVTPVVDWELVEKCAPYSGIKVIDVTPD